MSDRARILPAAAAEASVDSSSLRPLAARSMRASYELSPQVIDAFLASRLAGTGHVDGTTPDQTTIVAERNRDLQGFTRATVVGESATLRWLHVDPDHRGRGIGTRLFETVREVLAEQTEDLRVGVLAANREGRRFLERFDLECGGQREIDIGGDRLVEMVYVPPAVSGDEAIDEGTAAVDTSPRDIAGDRETASGEGSDVVDTEDGQCVLGEDRLSGTEAPFVPVYVDEDRTEHLGLYCENCGSTDVNADTMDRLLCAACGNAHRDREGYDGAYL